MNIGKMKRRFCGKWNGPCANRLFFFLFSCIYLEHSNAQTAFRWSKPLIVIVNWRQSPFPYHLQDTLMYFISLPSPGTLPPCTHRPTIINKRYLSRPSRNLLLLRPDLSLPRRIVHQPWSTPIQVSRAIVASPATLCEINYAFVI